MEAIEFEEYLFYEGEHTLLEVQRHYAGKDFRLSFRSSRAHGWRQTRELTRAQAQEIRDMLSRALEEWTS